MAGAVVGALAGLGVSVGGGMTGPAASGAPSAPQRTPGGLVVHSTLGENGVPSGTTFAASTSADPVVGAASTASGKGWWQATSSGGVFSFGDAGFHGSTGAIHLNQSIVGMASTPDGNGYWLVATDGGIFSFGDAAFHGSTGAIHLNQPIVGMASTPDGNGYWLVAADGGIFSFGDAAFHGSTGAIHLNQPIVGMASTPDGNGYWLVAADGGIFSFGDAAFAGSASGAAPAGTVVSMAADPSGGYWITDTNGDVFAYGAAAHVAPASGVLHSPVRATTDLSRTQDLVLVAADGSNATVGSGGVQATSVPVAPPAGSPSSYSFLATNPDGTPVRYNPCAPIHYVTNLAGGPANAAALVQSALAQVSQATQIQFVDEGSTSEVPSSGRAAYQPARYPGEWAPVLIAWSTPSATSLLPSGGSVIGEGGSSWVQTPGGGDVFVSGQAVINADATTTLAASYGEGTTLGELLLHELGHVVGLGHTSDSNQVMFPVEHPMATAAYQAGDLAGLAMVGKNAGCLITPSP